MKVLWLFLAFLVLPFGCSPTSNCVECKWIDYNKPQSTVTVVPTPEEQFCIDNGYEYLADMKREKHLITQILCCRRTR